MTSRSQHRARWAFPIALVSGLALSAAFGLGACISQPTSLETGEGGSGGAGGAGGEGGFAGSGGSVVTPGKAQSMFDALEADLYQACGPACHEAGGVADMPFLQGPDRYQSMISWPGIVVKDPKQSKFITYPVAGPQHPYKKLDQSPLDTELFPAVKAWLTEEAKGIVSTGEPENTAYIEPFVPIIGFNAIYLSPLGAELTGMAVTFNAYEIDEHVIELSDIQVHPTAMSGLHVVHPLFVVSPVGKPADPDPVDSFSNVEQTFEAGKAGTLGPGTLILSNWAPNAKLSLAFEKVEIVSPTGGDGGTGPTGGCKDVDAFMANAQGPLKQNCFTCHGGGNAQAKGAIDMSAIDSNPAAACGQVKNRVNPASPADSQLFVTTNPNGNAAHPYKFGGSDNNFNAFESAVSKWITAEQ